MKLELTKRDKKLLVGLGIFLLVIGFFFGVLRPLTERTELLNEQIAQGEIEKQEKELKVNNLPVLSGREADMTKSLDAQKSKYYGIMKSVDIGRLMTDAALATGATITDMNIKMPDEDAYTTLPDYRELLAASLAGNMAPTEEEEDSPSTGIYTATVRMTLSGSRDNLQKMLDQVTGQLPKQRLNSFEWKKKDRDSGDAYNLDFEVELYMCIDVDAYLAKREKEQADLEAAAAAENGGTTGENEAGTKEQAENEVDILAE